MKNCNIQSGTILRRKKVEERTGLSRSSLYQKISNGTFPAPIKLGARAVGWLESEIDDFIQARVTESRNTVKRGV
jgi:prophage regulatory protein